MKSDKEGIYVPNRIIFITVVVFICTNIFFLLMGILIGKDDNKWEEQTQTLAQEDVIATEPAPDLVTQELQEFENEARLEPEALDTDYSQPEVMAKNEPEPAPKDPPPPLVNHPKPEPNKQPVAEKKTPAPTASPSADTGGYWIQILAIKERDKASEFMNKVRRGGFSAAMIEEKGFYKVRVGPIAVRSQAEKQKAQLKKRFKVDGWIISK